MAFYKKQFNEKMNVYYPQAVTVGNPTTTKEIADRLAQISTVSYTDVVAVLAELPGVIADYMKQGKSVRLDGLGTFRYTLDTKGVQNEADFNFQEQVKSVRVQFTPTRTGNARVGDKPTRAMVPNGVEWIELAAAAAVTPDEETGGEAGSGDNNETVGGGI